MAILLIAALPNFLTASYTYFTPPADWQLANPKDLSPSVQISFFAKGKSGFIPSINLAVEPTDLSLSDYLKTIKKIHENNRQNHWHDLGQIQTEAGLAALTQLDTTTKWGAARLMQQIIIRDSKAYILTVAALKEDFPSYYQVFEQSLRSFAITGSMLQTLPQDDYRIKKIENLAGNVEEITQTIQITFPEKSIPWQTALVSECLNLDKNL